MAVAEGDIVWFKQSGSKWQVSIRLLICCVISRSTSTDADAASLRTLGILVIPLQALRRTQAKPMQQQVLQCGFDRDR